MTNLVAIVTGANKGIGYECVRLLASKLAHSTKEARAIIYLTARNEQFGRAARDALQTECKDTGTEIRYHQLDIASTASIKSFVQFFAKEHPEGSNISNHLVLFPE